MRIVAVREVAVPVRSELKNSSIDFSEMTTSVVAVVTDVVREGRPVTGFAFNSTGRDACGAQMRERFIPRLMAAKPESLLDATDENFDVEKVLASMLVREKSGGHSERSIAIGMIEVAVWDAIAKIASKAAPSRARRALWRRWRDETRVLLCGRRLVLAGPDHCGSGR